MVTARRVLCGIAVVLAAVSVFGFGPVLRHRRAAFRAASGGDIYTDFSTEFVAYWDLDEASGTRYDSRGPNDLTEHASVGNIGTMAGKDGDAADLDDANSEKLDRASTADLAPSVSMACGGWVYFDGLAHEMHLVAKASYDYDLYVFYTGQVRFKVTESDSGTATASSSNTISAGGWHHIVGIADGSDLYVYVDGVERGTAAYDGTIKQSGGLFYIGDNGDGYFFDGRTDEVAFFNGITFGSGAVRQAFIDDWYNGGTGSFYNP